MKFLISISLLFITSAFAAGDCQQKRNEEIDFFAAPFDGDFADKMAGRSCPKNSEFKKYDWGGDDLFEVETCLDGGERLNQYIEFQMTDDEYCVFPQYLEGKLAKPDFELEAYDIGLRRRGYDFDEDKYCGMKGRDKLKIEGGTNLVLIVGRGVVNVYFKCIDYDRLSKDNPGKYKQLAQKTCNDFQEKYINTVKFLRR